MAKKKDKGVAEVAPLFTKAKVIVSFHDKLQNKVVKVGDMVEWTKEREELKLIE